MQTDAIQEARRQVEICNACRYCEGYCSVFPELHKMRSFSDGEITQLANICHNCRGCFYACQYTAPHEFDLNLPAALAKVRHESWETYAWPQPLARTFQKSGVAITLATILAFALLFAGIQLLPSSDGEGFYAVLSHSAMVALFAPAFLFPLLSLSISMRRLLVATSSAHVGASKAYTAVTDVSTMKNLAGGHGDGCNFEDEDRFSHARRIAHQAVMYGFLLCFLSTISGTVLHYGFNWTAPYSFWSPPKLLGVPGGSLMVVGTTWLANLKMRADRSLGDQDAWGGEMAYIMLLFLVSGSGLALYWLGKTEFLPTLLALHLGSIFSLFLLTPYTKMAHGFYRFAAMIKG